MQLYGTSLDVSFVHQASNFGNLIKRHMCNFSVPFGILRAVSIIRDFKVDIWKVDIKCNCMVHQLMSVSSIRLLILDFNVSPKCDFSMFCRLLRAVSIIRDFKVDFSKVDIKCITPRRLC